MKILSLILCFTVYFFALANETKSTKRKPAQSLEDRVRSEFGLDRYDITCEFLLQGSEDVRPRRSVYYDEMTIKQCTDKAKLYLKHAPKEYVEVVVKHPSESKDVLLKREK